LNIKSKIEKDFSYVKPKVGVVVVDDGLYTHSWVSELVDTNEIDIAFIACINPFKAINFNPGDARGIIPASMSRWMYYGSLATFRFAAKALAAFIKKLLYRLHFSEKPNSVKSIAWKKGIRRIHVAADDINHVDFLAELAKYKTDIFVCAFSQKAEDTFLEIPQIGCLNIHFSMLPEHRGREPLFRAMLVGHGAGISVHWMENEYDAGDIVAQKSLDIENISSLNEAIIRATQITGHVVIKAIHIAMKWKGSKTYKGKLPKIRSWPSRKEIIEFRNRGYHFI